MLQGLKSVALIEQTPISILMGVHFNIDHPKKLFDHAMVCATPKVSSPTKFQKYPCFALKGLFKDNIFSM